MDQHYHVMSIFANGNVEDMKTGYFSLVKYSATYFSVHQMAPLALWKNIFKISKDVGKYLWKKNTPPYRNSFMCTSIKCSTRNIF